MTSLMAFIVAISIPFTSTVPAIEYDYTYLESVEPNTVLVEYVDMYESDMETKTWMALNLISRCYPDWTSSYDLNKFDCSEMSSFVSYFLNECGIENEIIIGKNSGGSKAYHAWIEVVDENNDIIIVEAITLQVVKYDKIIIMSNVPSSLDFYQKATRSSFEDFAKYETEWDWWNSDFFINENKLVDDKIKEQTAYYESIPKAIRL